MVERAERELGERDVHASSSSGYEGGGLMPSICDGNQSIDLEEFSPGRYHLVISHLGSQVATIMLIDDTKEAAEKLLRALCENASIFINHDIAEKLMRPLKPS